MGKDTTNLWINIHQASEILGLSIQTLKRQCRAGRFVYKINKNGKQANYYILLKSMPEFAQDKYLGETDINLKYSEVPNWAKQQAEKSLPILEATEGLKGQELKNYIDEWNSNNSSELQTSYPSVIKMRKRYFRYGLSGLISQHGQHLIGSSAPDNYFTYYKNLYLVEGAPSLRTCWDLTLGYAIRELGADRNNFPSFMSFKRRLDKEIPKQSIYLARNGQSAWNRKYGNYIERDYSNILYLLKVVKTQLEKFAPATAQKNINLGILDKLFFPLPPIKEQERIINKVKEINKIVDNL